MASPVDSWHAFKRWRRKAGLTQEAAAAMIGVSEATISRWENGKRFPESRHWPKIKEITEGAVTLDDFTPARSPLAGMEPAGARAMQPGAGDGSKTGGTRSPLSSRRRPKPRRRPSPSGGEARPPD